MEFSVGGVGMFFRQLRHTFHVDLDHRQTAHPSRCDLARSAAMLFSATRPLIHGQALYSSYT